MVQVAPIIKPVKPVNLDAHRLHLIGAPKSLLVIEDDLSMIEFIDAILDESHRGLEWEYVTSGEAAMELIKRRSRYRGDAPYSLVITDIFLEGETNGLDVWLDCQENFPDMPFAVTSSLPFDRYFSLLRGVNKTPLYLPKPLSISRFQNLFNEYFS